jgi:tetratricopeptide (TPR) repeat protein
MLLLAVAVATIYPEHADLLTSVMDELNTRGGISDGHREELAEAVKEEPKNVDLMAAYGFALAQSGDQEAALKPMKKALRLGKQQKPEEEPTLLHTTLVGLLMKMGKFADAAQIFATYGYALPAGVHQTLALRLAQGAQDATGADAARRHAAKAVEAAPEEPTSQLSHGLALLSEDPMPTEAATAALKRAFALRKQNATDSSFAEAWPPTLEAHASHMLGKLIATNPPEPEKNPHLEEAYLAFQRAHALAPEHEPYQKSMDEAMNAMLRRKHALEGEGGGSPMAAPIIDKNEL